LSSGCEPRPAKGAPTQPVASLATDAVTRPAMRRCAKVWAVGKAATKTISSRVPRGSNSSKATAVSPHQGEGEPHPAGCTTTARSKGTVQAPGRPTFFLGRHRSDGDPVITLRRAARSWMRARPADATQVALHRRSIRAEVDRRQGETGAAADGNGGVGGLRTPVVPHELVRNGPDRSSLDVMQSQDRRLLLSRDGLISRHHWRASVPLRPSVSRCPPPSPRASFARLHQAGQHATACGASHRDDTPILRLPLHEHHPFARAPDPPRAATAMTKKSDSAGLASRWGPLRGPAGRESAAGAPAPARGASGRTSRWLRDASPAAAPHGTVRTERARTRRSRRAPPPPDSRGIGRIALSTPALLVERLDARGVRRHAVHRRSRFSAAVAKARGLIPGLHLLHRSRSTSSLPRWR